MNHLPFLKTPFSSKNPHSIQYPRAFYDFSKNGFLTASKKLFL